VSGLRQKSSFNVPSVARGQQLCVKRCLLNSRLEPITGVPDVSDPLLGQCSHALDAASAYVHSVHAHALGPIQHVVPCLLSQFRSLEGPFEIGRLFQWQMHSQAKIWQLFLAPAGRIFSGVESSVHYLVVVGLRFGKEKRIFARGVAGNSLLPSIHVRLVH
jgi:hypothetical protein